MGERFPFSRLAAPLARVAERLFGAPEEADTVAFTAEMRIVNNTLPEVFTSTAAFYKPDQKRKGKGQKGGGQFEETGAEAKHKAEADAKAAATAAEQAAKKAQEDAEAAQKKALTEQQQKDAEVEKAAQEAKKQQLPPAAPATIESTATTTVSVKPAEKAQGALGAVDNPLGLSEHLVGLNMYTFDARYPNFTDQVLAGEALQALVYDITEMQKALLEAGLPTSPPLVMAMKEKAKYYSKVKTGTATVPDMPKASGPTDQEALVQILTDIEKYEGIKSKAGKPYVNEMLPIDEQKAAYTNYVKSLYTLAAQTDNAQRKAIYEQLAREAKKSLAQLGVAPLDEDEQAALSILTQETSLNVDAATGLVARNQMMLPDSWLARLTSGISTLHGQYARTQPGSVEERGLEKLIKRYNEAHRAAVAEVVAEKQKQQPAQTSLSKKPMAVGDYVKMELDPGKVALADDGRVLIPEGTSTKDAMKIVDDALMYVKERISNADMQAVMPLDKILTAVNAQWVELNQQQNTEFSQRQATDEFYAMQMGFSRKLKEVATLAAANGVYMYEGSASYGEFSEGLIALATLQQAQEKYSFGLPTHDTLDYYTNDMRYKVENLAYDIKARRDLLEKEARLEAGLPPEPPLEHRADAAKDKRTRTKRVKDAADTMHSVIKMRAREGAEAELRGGYTDYDRSARMQRREDEYRQVVLLNRLADVKLPKGSPKQTLSGGDVLTLAENVLRSEQDLELYETYAVEYFRVLNEADPSKVANSGTYAAAESAVITAKSRLTLERETLQVASDPNAEQVINNGITQLAEAYTLNKSDQINQLSYAAQYPVDQQQYSVEWAAVALKEKVEKYAKVHGVAPVFPKGFIEDVYEEGQQMALPMFVDERGNVLDAGRYDIGGGTFNVWGSASKDAARSEGKLQEYYADWSSKLGYESRDYIREYMGNVFGPLNSYLRTGDMPEEFDAEAAGLEYYDSGQAGIDEQYFDDSMAEDAVTDYLQNNNAPQYGDGEYLDPDTGEFDDEGFEAALQTWRDEHQDDIDAYVKEKKDEYIQGEHDTFVEDAQATFDNDNPSASGYDMGGMADSMDEAIRSAPVTPDNMLLYRRGRLNEAADYVPDPNDVWEEGEVLVDEAFVSSSIDLDVAERFGGERFIIEVPKGSTAAFVDTLTDNTENEMLLPKGSKFLYLGKTDTEWSSSNSGSAEAHRLRYLGPDYDPNNPVDVPMGEEGGIPKYVYDEAGREYLNPAWQDLSDNWDDIGAATQAQRTALAEGKAGGFDWDAWNEQGEQQARRLKEKGFTGFSRVTVRIVDNTGAGQGGKAGQDKAGRQRRRLTWGSGELRRTGKRIPLVGPAYRKAPRTNPFAPTRPRSMSQGALSGPVPSVLPFSKGTSLLRGLAGLTGLLRGTSAAGERALFYRMDQRRDRYGKWMDEGRAAAISPGALTQAQVSPRARYMASRVGAQEGSNEGGYYAGADGKVRYVKLYDDPTQAYAEHLANRIYGMLAVRVPRSTVFEDDGRTYYASDIVEGSTVDSQVGRLGLTPNRAQEILRGFVGDVLTGNRDVLGLDYDNVIDVARGHHPPEVYRVDNGSAFLHRAQGARKSGDLNNIDEWDTLGPGERGRNRNYAEVFATSGYDTPEAIPDLQDQLRRLSVLYSSTGEGGWAAYIRNVVPDMDPKDQQAIAEMLEARTALLLPKRRKASFSIYVDFYRPDQRRGAKGTSQGGEFQDEGRGGRIVDNTQGQERPQGSQHDKRLDAVKDAADSQLVRVLAFEPVFAYDMAEVRRVAERHGFTELVQLLDSQDRASWFGTVTRLHGAVAAMRGVPESAYELKIERVNLGVTPFRGAPATKAEDTQLYYQSTRYKGWLQDLRTEAERLDVRVEDVVKVTGVWQGSLEPSASVWVVGHPASVKQLASSLGGEYNQEGVLLFDTANDDGKGALYTLPGVEDQDEAVAAMQRAGIDGGRLVRSRKGGYALEIADFDGSMFEAVDRLARELGLEQYYTPGKVTLLEGGTDYERRRRPYRGRARTRESAGATA